MGPYDSGTDADHAPFAQDGQAVDDDASDEKGNTSNAITGTVVDAVTTRPLGGRTVAIGRGKATTDGSGRFTVTGSDAPYDVTIIDPDGSVVSIYLGLTRRDPVLAHKRSETSVSAQKSAMLSGVLSGGGPYPLGPTDAVSVYFFADEADNYALLGGGLPAPFDGPAYGPMQLNWNGPDSIKGRLVALGTFTKIGDAGYSAWYVDQPLVLMAGANAVVNLQLVPVAEGTIAGTVRVPMNASIVQKQVFYRLPFRHAVLGLGNDENSSQSFDYTIPDLTAPGADLCVGGVASPGLQITQRCGLVVGATGISITVQPPPSLSTPNDGATATKATRFSWTAFNNGMHSLQLHANGASRATPSIYVFTAATTTTWPDLSSIDVPFPIGADYECTIAGMGPFATMDDAAGPNGLGAPFPPEARRSYSQAIYLRTAP